MKKHKIPKDFKELIKDSELEIPTDLTDGFYEVYFPDVVANFVVEKDLIIWCSPIILADIDYWQSSAAKLWGKKKTPPSRGDLHAPNI